MADKTVVLNKKQAHIKINSKSCTVTEYLFPNESLGFALAKIDGRYPGAGKMLNDKVDLIYYVLSGSGVVHQEDGNYHIQKGDCFFLRKGTWYWIEGEKLKMAVPSAPAWSSKQYKHVD